MSQEIRRRWIEALCSGEFEQGKEYLHKDDKYCCLGVLCHLMKDELHIEYDSGRECFVYNNHWETLPASIASKVGLSSTQEDILVYLNDSGIPFSIIAKVIEEFK